MLSAQFASHNPSQSLEVAPLVLSFICKIIGCEVCGCDGMLVVETANEYLTRCQRVAKVQVPRIAEIGCVSMLMGCFPSEGRVTILELDEPFTIARVKKLDGMDIKAPG